MSLERIFDVAASALNAQSQRLNTVASNLANADSVAGPDGAAYKARQVVFQSQWAGARGAHTWATGAAGALPGAQGAQGVQGVHVVAITESQAPGRRVHDPKHPAADAQGYVTYSNVSPVEEMVNMISASRSYQNNVEVMNTARALMVKTLQLGQGG